METKKQPANRFFLLRTNEQQAANIHAAAKKFEKQEGKKLNLSETIRHCVNLYLEKK